MGMTIEKIIEIYNELDRISGTLLKGNSEEDIKYNSETIEALQSINVILHKYQKIQEIIAKRPKDMISSNPTLRAISEVLEDGRN